LTNYRHVPAIRRFFLRLGRLHCNWLQSHFPEAALVHVGELLASEIASSSDLPTSGTRTGPIDATRGGAFARPAAFTSNSRSNDIAF
jgi:hypothetical protein